MATDWSVSVIFEHLNVMIFVMMCVCVCVNDKANVDYDNNGWRDYVIVWSGCEYW